MDRLGMFVIDLMSIEPETSRVPSPWMNLHGDGPSELVGRREFLQPNFPIADV